MAPRKVADAIEAAHGEAVADALRFLEGEALFTREGKDGARQVETRGLVGAAFTHRDSRAGDPDLHTHVAVANKVQTLRGKWLSIYGRVLHQHIVAASETYNTALEHRLNEALGVQFVERPGGVREKRPVREVEGVDLGLCDAWSTRRADIVARQRVLSREFGQAHGRPPTAGRDCLMLAPSRELVRELNDLARAARLAGSAPTAEARLSDGACASVGDLVITRRNDRRLGVSGSDWVKNGDRWAVLAVRDGCLTVRHGVSGLTTVLPAEYVAAHVELGYASTVHTAQGITADVTHGIITGEETRQLLYTMLTRGRVENHVHVVLTNETEGHQLTLPGWPNR